MKTKFGKGIRAFYRLSDLPVNKEAQAIAPQSFKAEIFFGIYFPSGGCPEGFGELSMRWYLHGSGDQLTPRLEVYGEALRLLWKMRSIINATWRVSSSISPDEFCALLLKMGFKDLTETLLPTPARQDSATAYLVKESGSVVTASH
jgi:hypothetical protein